MKKRYLNIFIIITIIVFFVALTRVLIFSHKSSADNKIENFKNLDGELVPSNYILNPNWELYNRLSEEEKNNLEVIPEKYVMVYKEKSPKRGISTSSSVDELPDSFDLRNVNGKNYVSPVKNQRSLGLCWAFATMSSVESNLLITHPELSYYQMSENNVYDDATNVLTFSERQLDYITASETSNTDNYNPYSFNRILGKGGNFYIYSSSVFISGVSPVLESKWGSYNVETNPLSSSKIFDTSSMDYYIYETIAFPYAKESYGTSYTENVTKMIKKHLMHYGAVFFTAGAPFSECYDSVNDMYINNHCEEHAMSIIGWIDNYGPNNESVWIVKNSWGDNKVTTYVYYPINYDFTNEYYGVKEIRKKDWDNNYDISKNYEYNAKEYGTELSYEIKYYKNPNNDEYLKYINFDSNGQDITYNIYISEDGSNSNYRFVRSITKELPGITTIEMNNILLQNDAFAIKITSTNGTIRKSSFANTINAFTSNVNSSNRESVDVSYELSNNVISSDNSTIKVNAYTRNIKTGNYLQLLSVTNSRNEDVSNYFYFDDILILNGYAKGNIEAISYIPEDTYTFRIGNNTINDEFSIHLSNLEPLGISGIGTSSSPYVITSIEDLIKINSNPSYLNSHYILNNDLDLSICSTKGSVCYNDGLGWLPIGYDLNNKFKGSFNGNGHTINNLFIDRESSNYVGLFGYIEDGIVNNLKLTNVNINGNRYVGGLAGYIKTDLEDLMISNIYVNGRINGYTYVGGISGYLVNYTLNNLGNDSSIKVSKIASGIAYIIMDEERNVVNIYNHGDIEGETCGGLFGISSGNYYLNSSYNSGNINCDKAGGIIGNVRGEITMKDVFNSGNIHGNTEAGGIISNLSYDISLENIYNVGLVSCNDRCNQIIGYNSGNRLDIRNVYYLNRGSITNNEQGITAYTKEQFINKNNFNSFDFDSIWKFENDNTYPTLKNNPYYYISKIVLNDSEIEIDLNETYIINYTIMPNNANNKKLVFESDNESVATVSETGLVTPKSYGIANIHIKTTDNSYPEQSLRIIVKNKTINVTSIQFTKDSITLNKGEELQLDYIINPSNATNRNVIFASSNENVVTVNKSGIIKALKSGSAKITVKTEDGNKKDTITIIVKDNIILKSNVYEIKDNVIIINSLINNETFLRNITTSYKIDFDTSSTYLGTNKEIKIIDNQNVIKKYRILVYGDVTGDGKIDLSDIMKVANYIYRDNKSLSGVFIDASDYNKNKKTDLSDIMSIAKKVYRKG